MVRGNWQKRVERVEARRTAAKLQKEQRRNKRNSSSGGKHGDSKASYRRLEEWLEDKGDDIGVLLEEGAGSVSGSGSCITVDIWTDDRPQNRPEYIPPTLSDDDDDFHDDYDDEDGRGNKGRSKGKQKEKKPYKIKKGRGKGKAHPNANNKSIPENNDESIVSSRDRSGSVSTNHALKDDRLCGQEFFLGKDKCKGLQQIKQLHRQKGGRKGRSESIGGDGDLGCSFQHYHQLPKVNKRNKLKGTPPMTLSQVLNEKFVPHHIIQHNGDDDKKPSASLPMQVREAALKLTLDAAVKDASESACIDMIYHSRYIVENKAENNSNEGGDSSDDSDDHESINSSSGDEANTNNNQKSSKVLKLLQQLLEKENLTNTSLVYLSIQGVLIYDRNREGLVFTESQERFLLFGDVVDSSSTNEYADPNDNNNDDDAEQNKEPLHIHEQLTHHLLDEILSYAGDESVAILPQVCASWRDEVGTRSPQLWKMLLDRHGWPLSVSGSSGDEKTGSETTTLSQIIDGQAGIDVLAERDQCRGDFVSHYTVARDIRAMANTCNYMNGGNNGSVMKHKLGVESAMQIFKATKGAPMLEGIEESRTAEGAPYCYVKIWSDSTDAKYSKSTRALAAYEDCTLRLFDVVGGNAGSGEFAKGNIKCRQVVCVRSAPPSSSKKKDSCTLKDMVIDDDKVACLFYEAREEGILRNGVEEETDSRHTPWMTVISRDDIACAGNEGALDDNCIQSFDLHEAILQFIIVGVTSDTYEEQQEDLKAYDELKDDICTSVTPQLVACGKGHFLFHAHVVIPEYCALYGEDYDSAHPCSDGHMLFLFSTRKKAIVKSLTLERRREGTSLFASRPCKRRATPDIAAALCTSILVSGPTHHILLISVEIQRDGTIGLLQKPMIEREELAPWADMKAILTSSHAVFSTDPIRQGPLIHFQRIDDNLAEHFHTLEIPGGSTLRNMFLIQEHYIALVIQSNGENEDNLFDGHWFGEESEDGNTVEVIVFHILTRQEIYRCPFPSEMISVDCIGDTLALNLSHVGFVITGGNARDVAKTPSIEGSTQISSPSGKTPKSKKKRMASLASGRKKDGFARGMSHGG